MASLGASGRFQQNVERDLFRHARRELKVPWQLCYIDTLHRDSLRTTTARHPILPPHEVLGLVWKKSRDVFDRVFGTADLEGFWEKMFRSEPLHLQEHPARSDILKKSVVSHTLQDLRRRWIMRQVPFNKGCSLDADMQQDFPDAIMQNTDIPLPWFPIHPRRYGKPAVSMDSLVV